jgi:hypothetical protein
MAFPIRDVDFIAYDYRGQALLLAIVKGGSRETSELWAAQYRRNILAHGTLPAAPFFLIATPERMYFWHQRESDPEEELPQFTLDATNELGPYFQRVEITPKEARGETLELIVFHWLNDIAETGQLRAKEDTTLRWLSESGLLEALRKGRIELSVVQ